MVTSAADNGSPGTLRSVLAAAAPGDTITFDPTVFAVPQTIFLSGSELDISRNVTIQGPGANHLTIDAQGASYVFNISGGTVALSGMTVAHGAGANHYGGIVNAATLTLANVVVSGSTGVGLANSSSLSATNCVFSGNSNSGANYGNGGGLYNSGTASLSDCTFANNTAQFGGGLSTGVNPNGGTTRSGSATLTNCTFASNAAQYGGAIYDVGSLTATSCTFSGNSGSLHAAGFS